MGMVEVGWGRDVGCGGEEGERKDEKDGKVRERMKEGEKGLEKSN